MEAGPILPQWSDFFSLSSLLPAPLLPTCSSVVSIHALHEPHTFLVCLDGDSSSNLRHPILVTPWLWPPPSRHADVSVHRFLRVLTAHMGFLASCRSQLSWVRAALCARWKVLRAAASRGWVPCTCPWEWGTDTACWPIYITELLLHTAPRQPNGAGRLACDFSCNELWQQSSQKQNQKRQGEYTFNLFWRPKSLLRTHQSVPLFFRCWA